MTTPTYKSAIESKIYLTKDVVELRLAKPEGFSFTAGQFVQFHIPSGFLPESVVGKTILRSYSISSSPAQSFLEFCIKIVPSGVGSLFIKKMNVGDEVTFQGPQGRFVVPNEISPLAFVATGVGLAPIMGILEDELQYKKNQTPIHLLFGVRSETDIFWLERMETLARDYSNFTYRLTLSQPTPTWDALRGRVTEHLPEQVTGKRFFLCGSLAMVKDVRAALVAKGVEARTVHFEIF